MSQLRGFDEIYVISDIHMGGRRGFQILREVDRLARLIDHVGTVRPAGEVALIFNGDVIDSLAEDIDGYVATRAAPAMMERIYQNFAPIWDALTRLLNQPGRRVVFVTGNHDIEMALPDVERSIRARIAGADLARNGSLTFATHGAGYACQVGRARVYCTHGNEVDDWNIVDYGALSELGNALNAARDIDRDKWVPNAGTRMVVDVMNRIKNQYPFVDLLKPETKIVLPVLFVLDPDLVKGLNVRDAFNIGWGKLKGRFQTRGLLSPGDEDPDGVVDAATAAEVALDEFLGDNLRTMVSGGPSALSADPDEMLLEAEDIVRGGKVPVGDGSEEGTLGWFQMAVDRVRGVDKVDALRNALLDWLEDDDSFSLDKRDETFDKITARVTPEVDFVVTGHTHLARAIAIDASRFYYNCGTWIRLIRFTRRLLEDREAFAGMFDVLKSGSMEAIDKAKVYGQPLVLDTTSTVRIALEDDTTVGQLLRVEDAPRDSVKLVVLPGTEFRKS
jgi:UDP-2,3-diacylglucosamine pyrophosphatase LpxH